MEINDLYAKVREISQDDPLRAYEIFRSKRDELFRQHPQSPLLPSQLKRFHGLEYFGYDHRFHAVGKMRPVMNMQTREIDLGTEGVLRYSRIARTDFTLLEKKYSLYLYWIEGYGGGLFLPFRDQTNGVSTYAAGRYLFDMIKGAYLEMEGNSIILDFNFSYNPSCAYNDRWICPLPPSENSIPTPIEAGEKTFDH